MQLWTDKYKPNKLEEIAGQNKSVSEVLSFADTLPTDVYKTSASLS